MTPRANRVEAPDTDGFQHTHTFPMQATSWLSCWISARSCRRFT